MQTETKNRGWNTDERAGVGGGVTVAATQSEAVAAVALFEPGMLSLADEQVQAVIGNAFARTGELAADGNLTAAVRAFAGLPFNDEDSPWPMTRATSRPQDATSRTCSTSSSKR